MTLYTHDNTQGYTDAQLDELNRRASSYLAAAGIPACEQDAIDAGLGDARKMAVERVEQEYGADSTAMRDAKDQLGFALQELRVVLGGDLADPTTQEFAADGCRELSQALAFFADALDDAREDSNE